MDNYRLNKAGLLVPRVRDLHLLIDDGGDSELDFVGFTVVLLDESAYRELEKKVDELCRKEHISVLHSRALALSDGTLDDMTTYERIYRSLFQIAIHELRRANFQRVLSFLTSQAMITSVFSAHTQAFEKNEKLPQGARLAKKYRELYSYIAFPTIELLKKAKGIDEDMQLYIHIDRKKNFQNLAEEKVSLAGSSVGALLTVKEAIAIILNSWKKLFLKVSARIKQIHITDSANFPLIGVADAFSNFSLNFARVILKGEQNSSATQKMKYRLFREVVTTMIDEDPSSIDAIENSIGTGFRFDGKKIIPLTNNPVSTFEISRGI